MLAFISWSQYWIIVCLALVVYYSILWERYYRGQWNGYAGLVTRIRLMLKGNTKSTEANKVFTFFEQLDQAFEGKRQKEELLMDIRHRLQANPFKSDPIFRQQVEDWLLDRSFEKGSIHLEREELSRLWDQGVEH